MKRLSLIICTMLVALAAPVVADDDDIGGNGWKSAPLVKMIREATRDYRDPEVAKASGYAVVDPWCISGPAGGATGVHFLNPGLVGDGVVDANAPEILVYEPSPSGKLRLVAVEYIVFAPAPVAVEGHLMNVTGTPNRFGIPAPFLRLHVWAWKQNPKGTFADYNPTVSCDAQPLDP
jgi:hypothetical protein